MDEHYEIIYSQKRAVPGDIEMATQDPTLRRIEALVGRRGETDRRMGYIWMIVPLLPVAVVITIGSVFVGILVSVIPKIGSLSQPTTTQSEIAPIIGGIVALYGLAFIVFFAVLFFGALSFYYLIDRRNNHFSRQKLLFATIHRYLSSKVPLSENMAQLGFLSEDSGSSEESRPAGLWALLFLFVTPIAGLIASYNLTQDIRKHDELQSKYQATLVPSLLDAGFQVPDFPAHNSRRRDPILFIILTAVTGGLFWIYWYYTLLRDYNEHFTDQAKFEDQILKILVPPPTRRICQTCGGIVPTSAKFCPNCGSKQTT